MRSPDERIIEAARIAFAEVSHAIGETEFAVSLATRLRTLEPYAQARREYLVTSLAALYEARDVLEQALPPVPAVDTEA